MALDDPRYLPKLNKPPLLGTGNPEGKRRELREYFCQTWDLYESLFALINADEAYFLRPEPLRHPLIFYYGHTAVFFVNKLLLGKFIQQRVDPQIESICAVGVDEMSWDDLKPDNYQWPSVDEVRDYRNAVKRLVLQVIDNMPLNLPITQDSVAWVILMGCEHERIHIETSSVIMRMLEMQYLTSDKHWQPCNTVGGAVSNSLIKVDAKNVVLGKPSSNDTYGWDNEYGKLTVEVDTFAASQCLVSNAEYLQFVQKGGYQHPDYWTEEGQNWLKFTQAKHPRFWFKRGGEYWQRNLTHEIPLPLDWPVEVNYLEAKAFCNWKAEQSDSVIRLPTEAEWQVLRDQLDSDLPDWKKAPGNINLEYCASSCPVDHFKQGDFYDLIGNVWQWTESPIDGYPGFEVHPLYDDFSTPTFDGRHNLIKGGSWISTGNEACRDSRYAFRRHFMQHAGFRYVQANQQEVPLTPMNVYESQSEISQMLHHHYASATLPADMQAVMDALVGLANSDKALDIGCGTGRLSFALASQFKKVDGIDFTARHIQHALQLKQQDSVRYAMPSEGELVDYHEVSLECLGMAQLADKVDFYQGDGHNLKPQFTGYDVIVCHDVLDKVYDPALFLRALCDRLTSGGHLLVSCAYQWHRDYTEKTKWLSGYKADGENVVGIEGINAVLASVMRLQSEQWVNKNFALNQHQIMQSQLHISHWCKT